MNPAPLTIAASSASMTYGGATPAILPLYSGFVNGDTSTSLTTAPTCSTTATSTSPVGSYPSSCSGAVDSNYTITYVNGRSGQQAPLSIAASSGSMTYGGTVPTITAVVLGLRERRHGCFAHHGADVLHHGHVRRARWAATRARARAPSTPTTRSPT